MRSVAFIFLFYLGSIGLIQAQFPSEDRLVAGPMIGHVGTNEAVVWMLFKRTESATLRWFLEDRMVAEQSFDRSDMIPHGRYSILKSRVEGLEPSSDCRLDVFANGEPAGEQSFRTRSGDRVYDFRFITGSCAMRPPNSAKWLFPGPEEAIYPVMSREEVDFMLWLGDNVYYLLRHFGKPEMMYERRIDKRQVHEIDAFLRSMPQYAIWDDHDFGPDNAKGNFALADTSLYIHQNFWANPYNGTVETPGTFSHFRIADVEFFLTDNRYHSTLYKAKPSAMLGKAQMEWLKEGLRHSTATFKFVAVGSQVLNKLNPSECWYRYPGERQEMLDFIAEEGIRNVIFLTGDRHHTELMTVDLPGGIPVWDFTCSPLTSVTNKRVQKGAELLNPLRVPGTLLVDYNYGRISVTGEARSRICMIEVLDRYGDPVWTFKLPAE